MDANPLVTVVIPTWNRAPLVQQSVESVVAQTYGNWELFIVDDGSTDDTVWRLNRFALPNIHVLQSEHLGHIGKVRNLGARAGRGEFIAFLDSDDLWRPDKLERQIRAIQMERTGWSYTEYGLFTDDCLEHPLRSGRAPAISGNILQALLKGETGVCPCTLLVQRTLFEPIGGFSEEPLLAYRDDADIALRLARASEVTALPEKLTLVREHTARLTATLPHPHEHSAAVYEFFLQHEESRELTKIARERLAECLFGAGAQRAESGEYAMAAALFWRAFIKAGPGSGLLRALARGIRGRIRARVATHNRPLKSHG